MTNRLAFVVCYKEYGNTHFQARALQVNLVASNYADTGS